MTTSNVRCPIAGCKHTFEHGILGWDGHVGSVNTHTNWHPGVTDFTRRKALFVREFSRFFEQALTKKSQSGFFPKVSASQAQRRKAG